MEREIFKENNTFFKKGILKNLCVPSVALEPNGMFGWPPHFCGLQIGSHKLGKVWLANMSMMSELGY